MGKKTEKPAKKAAKKEKSGGGRPSSYKPEFAEQAKRLLLLNAGATNEDIARYFGKNPDTIYEWIKKYPEFSEALHAGKTPADVTVANSLFERATGARWVEEVAFKVKTIQYQDGRKISETEEVKVVQVQKAAPPDTQAIGLWLFNRDRKNWRQKPEPDGGDDDVQPVKIEIKVVDASIKPDDNA